MAKPQTSPTLTLTKSNRQLILTRKVDRSTPPTPIKMPILELQNKVTVPWNEARFTA